VQDVVEPAARLLEMRADLTTVLFQQVASLREVYRRERVLRRAVQYSARTMLDEEFAAETPAEAIAELRERLTRALMLLATAGEEIDDDPTGGGASTT
jgi:hypothetical protein